MHSNHIDIAPPELSVHCPPGQRRSDSHGQARSHGGELRRHPVAHNQLARDDRRGATKDTEADWSPQPKEKREIRPVVMQINYTDAVRNL